MVEFVFIQFSLGLARPISVFWMTGQINRPIYWSRLGPYFHVLIVEFWKTSRHDKNQDGHYHSYLYDILLLPRPLVLLVVSHHTNRTVLWVNCNAILNLVTYRTCIEL